MTYKKQAAEFMTSAAYFVFIEQVYSSKTHFQITITIYIFPQIFQVQKTIYNQLENAIYLQIIHKFYCGKPIG